MAGKIWKRCIEVLQCSITTVGYKSSSRSWMTPLHLPTVNHVMLCASLGRDLVQQFNRGHFMNMKLYWLSKKPALLLRGWGKAWFKLVMD